MGCGSSASIKPRPEENRYDRSLSSESPLTPSEIKSRTLCSETSTTLKLSKDLAIKYAYLTQRGYYPDDISKPNQDNFCVEESFNGDPSKIFFGVFDGHGAMGDLCSTYCKCHVPKKLQHLMNEMPFETAYSKCFVDTNNALHASSIEDSMSGTTAICMFMEGDTIHVANVGDSRAIIAKQEGGKIISHPLSVDQTPFRLDERERVKKYGALVMTLDQLEGLAPMHENWGLVLGEEVDEEGDPPRVWSPHGSYPGTAFTRSLGDQKAEELGVVAEPEIYSIRLTHEDKFIVLASDGVFEFLTSQAVVDIVNKYDDPVAACRAVVAEAYNLWLHYEVRTDDITCIVIFIKEPKSGSLASSGSSSSSSNDLLASRKHIMECATQLRPVRRGMSRAKRRAQMGKDMASMITEKDRNYVIADHIVPKTQDEILKITDAVKSNFFFQHLSMAQRSDIFSVMERIEVKKGDVIIRQGDEGSKFYVIQCGDFQVTVKSGDKEEIVHTYLGTSHPSFGELALMHGNPRSSTVTAITDGKLWAIDCHSFRKIVLKSPNQKLVQTLSHVGVLASLNLHQLERLADMLTEVSYKDGECILEQGQVGNTFYVIQEGNVICTVLEDEVGNDRGKTAREVLRLGPNQYFGEKALLRDAPRAANVISVGNTKLLQIGRQAFEELLGPLEAIINVDCIQQEAKQKFQHAVMAALHSQSQSNPEMVKLTICPNSISFLSIVHPTDIGYIALFQMKNEQSTSTYTCKVVSKQKGIELHQTQQIMKDRKTFDILKLSIPNIPMVSATWSNSSSLFLAIDTICVCELATITDAPYMDEEAAKIYVAQILLSLEELHSKGYVYRAISPEQLLIDDKGYIQLLEYRYSKQIGGTRTYTLCGTPEYLAPEMVSAQGHNYSVDYWALGILIFDMLCGYTPFTGHDDHEEISELEIYARITRFKKGELHFPDYISDHSRDLIEKLLHPSVYERIGCQGQVDTTTGGSIVRAHPWFQSINWVNIASKQNDVPFKEEIKKRLDHHYASKLEAPIFKNYEDSKDDDLFEGF